MSLCINPGCSKPENPDPCKFCQACGSELVLLGRYRVTRLLSNKGGFGYTYEVMDHDTSKVLKVLINDHPHALELFEQEAEVLCTLSHPGIPKGEGHFKYFIRNNPTPLHCLLMEKIEGIDLEDYQRKHDFHPINQELALEWLSQIASILHEVHRRHFFHRDIKPSNIILKPDGQLSLIDFGAARQVTGTIISGGQNTGIYTVGYAPPEQERGYAVPQSDFYALGRTFVYLLTGKEPNDAAIYDYHNNELNWRKLAPNINKKLADFIDELMANKVIERPTDTSVILQKINRLKQDLLQPSTPPSPPTVSQNKTITQKKAKGATPVKASPKLTMMEYGGFWLRFQSAMIDEIIVMSLAAFVAGYLSYKLETLGLLDRWGIHWSGTIKELIIASSIASALGTTILGLILILLGILVMSFTPEYLSKFIPVFLNTKNFLDFFFLLKTHFIWLVPILLGSIIKWLYYLVLEWLFQGTFGKLFFGLQVRNLQNKRLSLRQINRRYWSKILSSMPLYLGFMLAGWTPRKRALHDWMAGSIVVKKSIKTGE
ncbi:protein kinase domain-containing protein [Gloeothece verrucosa]|uniref:Serine/threonine protein kinase n=1 Tax=Gloeothece verrucosa (strain PCC 7822) TaxID=497965 RepID=E0UJY3_GLOV7|nr:protein kinase [Gloeothece verrucosa]ADN14619.1 serine/threonine protein kinase [Gloeothece verrucosa PCC 7822]